MPRRFLGYVSKITKVSYEPEANSDLHKPGPLWLKLTKVSQELVANTGSRKQGVDGWMASELSPKNASVRQRLIAANFSKTYLPGQLTLLLAS